MSTSARRVGGYTCPKDMRIAGILGTSGRSSGSSYGATDGERVANVWVQGIEGGVGFGAHRIKHAAEEAAGRRGQDDVEDVPVVHPEVAQFGKVVLRHVGRSGGHLVRERH